MIYRYYCFKMYVLSSGIWKIFSYTSLVEKNLLFLRKIRRTHVFFLENLISFYNFAWNMKFKALTYRYYCFKMYVLSSGIWKIFNYTSLIEKNYFSLENFEELIFKSTIRLKDPILIHGPTIIERCELPIGMLSEEV